MDNTVLNEDLASIFAKLDQREQFKKSTILITGCAGFLGFYFMHFFTRYQKELGIERLVGIDTFILGKPDWLSNLEKEHADTLFVHHADIASASLEHIEGANSADFVIHMASIASPSFYRAHPVETVDANVWGLRRLLDFYKNKPVKGFLFFSSSEVYGDPVKDEIPTSEEYRGNVQSMGPRACYDEAKRFGETLSYIYAKQFSLPITIVRPFNNYGPGMKLTDKRVPADFARAIVENKDIAILSNGRPTRTFCYVADAILGYLKALTFGTFDYFNIGIDHPEISIHRLAEIFQEQGKKHFNYTGNVTLAVSNEKEYLSDNPQRRCPNMEKARTLLRFEPAIEVEEGVERFLRFLKSAQ